MPTPLVHARPARWLPLLFLLVLPAAAQQALPELSLEALFSSSSFAAEGFQGGRWADEGPVVTYVVEQEDGSTDLVSYDLATDRQEMLIDGSGLEAPDTGEPLQIEDYAFGPDGQIALLYTDSERVWRLNTKGYYYLYDRTADRLVPLSDRDAGFQMFAKLNADASQAAFVRDRNLFLVDLATGDELQLTFDGAEGAIINGTSDWVYEEEFGLRDGFRWSPDGRHLAFFQFDESDTRAFSMADLRGQYPELTTFRYPKAGETNSEVRVGAINVRTGTPLFFDTDTWFEGADTTEYIPQMGWTPAIDGTHYVWMFRLDRDQNTLDLLYGDPATGEVTPILREENDTWLDVETGFSDLDVGTLTYLEDGEHFVWISTRDGYRHLYLYANDGTLVRPLTEGAWDVTDFHGVDLEAGRVYFTATRDGAAERHLYAAPFEGGAGAEPVRITQKAGWHSVSLSRDKRYYIDTWSDATTPPIVSLHGIDGQELQVLESNEALAETLAALDLPAPTFTQVPGADGTPLNAYLIRPSTFDPSQEYPLLLHVYGGPGSQEVRNAWAGTERLWHYLLAERYGVVVAGVDNRGTGGRGKAFLSSTYRRLGTLEAEDQIAAAQHLAAEPWVDGERVGIWGWSYGGFVTLLAMLTGEGPETFSAGVAVAPVTDWRQYDTIYTERYMSTPQSNPEGYDATAPTAYAANLQADQALLIVHGDLDDNVHFQNAVQMVDALIEAGKQFDVFFYPGRNHGIYGGDTRLHLYTMLTDYFREHLATPSNGDAAEM